MLSKFHTYLSLVTQFGKNSLFLNKFTAEQHAISATSGVPCRNYFVNNANKKDVLNTGKVGIGALLASLALTGCQTMQSNIEQKTPSQTQDQAQYVTQEKAPTALASKAVKSSEAANTKAKVKPQTMGTAQQQASRKTAQKTQPSTAKDASAKTKSTTAKAQTQSAQKTTTALAPSTTSTSRKNTKTAINKASNAKKESTGSADKLAQSTPNFPSDIEAKIAATSKNAGNNSATLPSTDKLIDPKLTAMTGITDSATDTTDTTLANTSASSIKNPTDASQNSLLNLQALPQRINETWTVDIRQADKPSAHCILLSQPQTLDDGQGTTTFKVMLDQAKIRFQTASNIDLSYPNTGVVITGKTTQRIKLDGLERETTAVINKNVPAVLAALREANQMDVYLGFWPTWPMTETKRISMAMNDFAQAEATLKACNQLVSGE